MSEKEITVYSLSTCGHCKSSMELLDECNAPYDFFDVDLIEKEDRKDILREIKRLNPRCSFPTIMIGEKVVVGFKEDEIREALKL